jgi:hypothetical protein
MNKSDLITDCICEGFPDMTPEQFIEMFMRASGCPSSQIVNRISFKRLYKTNKDLAPGGRSGEMKRIITFAVALVVMLVSLGGCSTIPIEGHERGDRDRPDIEGGFGGYDGRR